MRADDEETAETPTPVDTTVEEEFDRDEKKDGKGTLEGKKEKLNEAPAPSTVDPEPKATEHAKEDKPMEHEPTKSA